MRSEVLENRFLQDNLQRRQVPVVQPERHHSSAGNLPARLVGCDTAKLFKSLAMRLRIRFKMSWVGDLLYVYKRTLNVTAE